MALKDLIQAITNELITTQALPRGFPVKFGPTTKNQRMDPPSTTPLNPKNLDIYWIPKRSKNAKPIPAYSQAVQAAVAAAGGTIPRILWTRNQEVWCSIWAGGAAATDDYSACEAFLEQVVSSVQHQLGSGCYEFMDDEWVKSSDTSYLGHRLIARFIFMTPVFDLPAVPNGKQSIEVDEIDITDQLGPIQPGGTITSESTILT